MDENDVFEYVGKLDIHGLSKLMMIMVARMYDLSKVPEPEITPDSDVLKPGIIAPESVEFHPVVNIPDSPPAGNSTILDSIRSKLKGNHAKVAITNVAEGVCRDDVESQISHLLEGHTGTIIETIMGRYTVILIFKNKEYAKKFVENYDGLWDVELIDDDPNNPGANPGNNNSKPYCLNFHEFGKCNPKPSDKLYDSNIYRSLLEKYNIDK